MMHPEFLHNFLRTQTYLRQNASLVASVIEKSKEELFEKDGNVITISIPELRKLHPFELYVHELFHPYGFFRPISTRFIVIHEWKTVVFRCISFVKRSGEAHIKIKRFQ